MKKANELLEEAFSKKYNRNSLQKVPKWMWGVVAFFAYDNVMDWMRHPLILFLMMAVFVACGYLFATGNLFILSNIYHFIYAYIMSFAMSTPRPPISSIWAKKETIAEEDQNQSPK